MVAITRVLDLIDRELDRSVERLFDLARIPSISTDPAFKSDCRRAARWLCDELSGLGFDASLRDTQGHPMVVAHYRHDPHGSGPHLLFYGHYDVQPADPLDKWLTPPFEPERRKVNGRERLYGRGLADDKGQLMTFIEAFRHWLTIEDALPIRVTVLLEGEEESGSPSLVPFLEANRDELTCDVAFVCDTDLWDARTPAIVTRLRGLLHEEITVHGPRIDLHSGLYGGAAQNPARSLAKIIAGLHDAKGRVAVPGFYEGVDELPPAIKRQWKSLKFSERDFLRAVGLSVPVGEKGRMLLEQIWSRPTLEVNGMFGGYTGQGTKTVLPAEATAKISCRLVGRQDPKRIRAALRRHVKANLPTDCKVRFSGRGGSPAVVIPEKSPFIAMAEQGLKAEFGRAPVLIGSGGSIPVVGHFKRVLKMDSVLVGFGLDDDAIHSPNEKYDLASFHKGMRSWARILAELAR